MFNEDSEEKIVKRAIKDQPPGEEHGTDADHQLFEPFGSPPQSSTGGNSATGIAEAYGGEVCRSGLAESQKTAPGTTLSMPISARRRSSPELLHLVNSDRDNSWQKRCTLPAADRCRSGTNK